MIQKQIRLINVNYNDLINLIYEFSNSRNYIRKKETNNFNDNIIITIYDKKPESFMFSNFIDGFIGRNNMPDRIRIIIRIINNKNFIELIIIGDVIMMDMDFVNDKPKKYDLLKLENTLENLMIRLNNLQLTRIDN